MPALDEARSTSRARMLVRQPTDSALLAVVEADVGTLIAIEEAIVSRVVRRGQPYPRLYARDGPAESPT